MSASGPSGPLVNKFHCHTLCMPIANAHLSLHTYVQAWLSIGYGHNLKRLLAENSKIMDISVIWTIHVSVTLL